MNKNPFRSGPATLSRPKATQLPPETTARKGMCEGGIFAVPPSHLIRADALKSAKRYALPRHQKRTPPAQNAQACPHARGGMCEGRTICGSSLRVISGQWLPLYGIVCVPPAPAKKTPLGRFCQRQKVSSGDFPPRPKSAIIYTYLCRTAPERPGVPSHYSAPAR